MPALPYIGHLDGATFKVPGQGDAAGQRPETQKTYANAAKAQKKEARRQRKQGALEGSEGPEAPLGAAGALTEIEQARALSKLALSKRALSKQSRALVPAGAGRSEEPEGAGPAPALQPAPALEPATALQPERGHRYLFWLVAAAGLAAAAVVLARARR